MRAPLSTTFLAIGIALAGTTVSFGTDIRVTKKALAESVLVGDLVQFELVADNTSTTGGGPLQTQSTTITDDLPPEFEFVGFEGEAGQMTNCTV
ncbi:MAG TPA: hypothetical protein VJB15_03365, partial [Rhodothermia bacterium]|nr:hypothetical protein [Rhodothermia bacterium]